MVTKLNNWFFRHIKTDKSIGPFSLKGLCLSMIESGMNINDIIIHTKDKSTELNANDFSEFTELYQTLVDTVNFDNKDEYQINDPSEISFKSLASWKVFSKIENAIIGEVEIANMQSFLYSKNLGLDQVYLCQMKYETWNRPILDLNFFKQYLPTLGLVENNLEKSEPFQEWSELDLKCIIVSNGKTFRSKCIAFNTTSLKLNSEISEHFLNSEIEVFINSPDMKINIKIAATIKTSEKSEYILNLVNPSPKHIELISSWQLTSEEKIKKIA